MSRVEKLLYTGVKRMVDKYAVPVDPDKFDEVLRNRKLTQKELGEKIRFNDRTISSAKLDGVFQGGLVTALESIDILPKQYEYKPKEINLVKKAQTEDTVKMPVEESVLYVTMKAALTDALNEAIAENMREMVFGAVKEAMKEVWGS